MGKYGSLQLHEPLLLCRKALREKQTRKHVPECLGGQTGCGWPGGSPEPEPHRKAGGIEEWSP